MCNIRAADGCCKNLAKAQNIAMGVSDSVYCRNVSLGYCLCVGVAVFSRHGRYIRADNSFNHDKTFFYVPFLSGYAESISVLYGGQSCRGDTVLFGIFVYRRILENPFPDSCRLSNPYLYVLLLFV